MKGNQVAIIGHGFVGRATEKLLQKVPEIGRIFIQDPKYDLIPKHGPATLKRISPDEWDFIKYAFICVPTPLQSDISVLDYDYEGQNKFDMSCIEEAVKDIPQNVQIVIRSTIGPDNIKDGWIHMPEFLRERHWEEDIEDVSIPIVVGCSYDEDLLDWFPERNVIRMEPKEAAMYKLSRNAMLAAKVTLTNYIFDVCNEYNVNYDNVKDMLSTYGNLGDSHWDVPGPDGNFGFGGTCFPKDTTHFSSLLKRTNIFEYILRDNERNRKIL